MESMCLCKEGTFLFCLLLLCGNAGPSVADWYGGLLMPPCRDRMDPCVGVGLTGTSWTVACQASLSMGFSGQEYWNGLPLFSSGDLPDPGMKPICPALAVGFPHPTPNLVWMSRLVMSHTHTPRSYEIFIAYVIEVSLWRAGLKCLETRERAWLSFYCG